MLRNVGHRRFGLGRQGIHVPGRLGQKVQKLQPLVAGEGGSHASELSIEGLLKGTVTHSYHCITRNHYLQ